MVVKREALRVTKGEAHRYSKTADSGRVAVTYGCGVCRTNLWNEPLASPDIYIVRPGTLDESSWTAPAGHIWTDRKLPWVEIDPALPAFAGQPASRQPLYDAWDRMVEGAS
jgi:hypothetical protein